MACALIALGSNLGDRAANLRFAQQRMAALPRTRLAQCSGVYETPPVGPEGQGPYLNAACELATELPPHELHEALQQIERDAGRDRRDEVKWGPRTLDLDLLLYDDRVIDDERLVVPHPRMHERPFVLVPVCDIAADRTHPQLDRTMVELLGEVTPDRIERIDGGW